MLNNYSECLKSASTTLQTSLKHTFSEEILKHNPISEWALISRSLLQELAISPILLDETQ